MWDLGHTWQRFLLTTFCCVLIALVPLTAHALTGAWTNAASLAVGRDAPTSTLLPSGKVMIAGGYHGGTLAEAEIYDPASNTWQVLTMPTPRRSHAAVVLPSGKVLLAGGYGANNAQASADIYDPVSNTWSSTASMSTARTQFSMVLLPSGLVLAVGGNYSDPAPTAELYDPVAGTWSQTGAPPLQRYSPTAALLPSGKVLVAGGSNTGNGDESEIYDPSTNAWTATANLLNTHANPSSMLLPSGKVLLTGAVNIADPSIPDSEIYDPASDTWTATAHMPIRISYGVAGLLPSGRMLLVGGQDSNYNAVTTAQIYDPVSDTWQSAANMNTATEQSVLALLPSGQMMVAGGDSYATRINNVQLYDPAVGTLATAGDLAQSRASHTATPLMSGKVIVAGGNNLQNTLLAATEQFDPATALWSSAGNLSTARVFHSATLLLSGKVLVSGGYDHSNPIAAAELYDPGSNSWNPGAANIVARYFHTATLLPSGKVLVAGGFGSPGALASSELYDAASDSWSAAANLDQPGYGHDATLLANGQILLSGGFVTASSVLTATASLYDPASDTWQAVGSMATPRFDHTSTLLPSGKVLIAGGLGADNSRLATAELYDPVSATFSPAGSMNYVHAQASATLLASGKVLLLGNNITGSGDLSNVSAELYDPLSNSWSVVGTLQYPRSNATTTLLANGQVLIAGTDVSAATTSELFTLDPGHAGGRPVASSSATQLGSNASLALVGSGFDGAPLGYGGGGSYSTPTNMPLVQLRRIDNAQMVWARPDPASIVSGTNYFSAPFSGVPAGQYAMTMFVNAIPSVSQIISILPVHQVSASADSNGSISPTGMQTVVDGGTLVFTLTPASGYHVSSVSGSCVGTLSGTQFTTAAVSADCTVMANFSSVYTVMPSVGAGTGTISPTSAQRVPAGTTIQFTLTPASGSHIDSITGTCGGSRSGSVFTTNAINSDCSVIANFAIDTFVVNAAVSGSHGSITPASQSVLLDASANFIVVPDTGYSASVTGDTCTVSQVNGTAWSSTAISAACNVTAVFTPIVYTVNALAATGAGGTAHGTISPPSQGVSYGNSANFTVVPDAGFKATLSGDTCTLTHGIGNSWTSTAITGNCAVTAQFSDVVFKNGFE